MNVGELIEKLSGFEPEHLVIFEAMNESYLVTHAEQDMEEVLLS